MKLVYKFHLNTNKTLGRILSSLTYASARLFNVGNYERHEYKELGFDKMPSWYEQKKRLKDHEWFKALPSQTAQDVLQRVDEGWKSYFKLIKTKGILEPKPPFYKPKGGHYNVKYLNNSFKVLGNQIRFMIPKKQKEYLKDKFNINDGFFYIRIDKNLSNIKQIEFKYLKDDNYDVYIVYEELDSPKKESNNYISIDLGICNLATIYDNKGKSFIISGNSYLNTLYYYNKRIAHYQSIAQKQQKNEYVTTKRINKLFEKKNRIIEYIIHASTKRIISYCIENNITNVIIGDITGIREDNNIGKVNNQKLHNLPFDNFYKKLDYKCKRNGINLFYQKEAYTSSCPIDSKDISKEYQDKGRFKRGLYRQNNIVYNADSVGAFNIMRLFKMKNNHNISMVVSGLSNPNKISICVTR